MNFFWTSVAIAVLTLSTCAVVAGEPAMAELRLAEAAAATAKAGFQTLASMPAIAAPGSPVARASLTLE